MRTLGFRLSLSHLNHVQANTRNYSLDDNAPSILCVTSDTFRRVGMTYVELQ